MPSEFGADDPAAMEELPPVPVRFGVPTFTQSVPRDATALPNASRTARARFSIASPRALSTQPCAQHLGRTVRSQHCLPPCRYSCCQVTYPEVSGSCAMRKGSALSASIFQSPCHHVRSSTAEPFTALPCAVPRKATSTRAELPSYNSTRKPAIEARTSVELEEPTSDSRLSR